ncbi:DUF1801 domain-containing protein [Pontibacter sp. G13]|uniref:DUF1801 domain-containing protein n=1 Tax=Pontibacter sp. G13 TaxID=3074898 RepID=UPI0028899E86|nr:DUF1801 domain-containing protein [Pontibacter sp. G13]WNJ17376.1 DUF1801 domain-containing protein [Pontibacter sp. G13]
MASTIDTPEQYLAQLPEDRKAVMEKLRAVILERLPDGFHETISYGMIGYVVPHERYPDGYHCDPKLPLPFLSIASQKSHIGVYHMGIYANPELMEWFVQEYPKYSSRKLDMGKSCIRFKKMDQVPYDLIGDLVGRMTVDDWVELYESHIKR